MSLLTFTANPLAETTYTLAQTTRLGLTQRAVRESFQVGGKGFNVAKMAHRLGIDVTAVSFSGGHTGEACRDWLSTHASYAWQLVSTRSATRAGTVIRDAAGPETTFLGPDCVLDEDAAHAAATILAASPPTETVAICGSFPAWREAVAAPLRDGLTSLAQSGRLVVDAYGPILADLVRLPLALVKINRHEWLTLAESLELPESLPAAATSLPVQRWVITDGPKDIEYLAGDDHGFVLPSPVNEVSATGSGDVFLATLLAGAWRDGRAWPALLQRASLFASRNAAHFAIAEFDLPD